MVSSAPVVNKQRTPLDSLRRQCVFIGDKGAVDNNSLALRAFERQVARPPRLFHLSLRAVGWVNRVVCAETLAHTESLERLARYERRERWRGRCRLRCKCAAIYNVLVVLNLRICSVVRTVFQKNSSFRLPKKWSDWRCFTLTSPKSSVSSPLPAWRSCT